ncbi:hypothetical protein Lal_00048520 [Lupinus albus]|uniref:Putative PB1 domain-containing protein n=1 Tax=Lupinus albus TaxID=3870 RepID=A0A6A5M805_LUPAL|nr:putative PB1 domain-containing protein [Lupinus albus]KAF1869237.1 hypothetical protein Lal_00048520 [Lupinus albus]
MEKIQPFSSDPNSLDTSPTSRDVVVDNNNNNHSSFDEPHSTTTTTIKVKFICSYGGKIQPRPHDNHLSYVGGDTKILAVDRNIKYSAFMTKVSSLANNANLCFKYQLPGEDLDALISVTNDEDLDNMMIEYDRLSRASSTKPARMRLILFPLINNAVSVSVSSPVQNFAPTEPKPERQWFVDALNSVQIPNLERSSPQQNPDFLFGFDKVYPKPPDPAPSPKVSDIAAKDSECGPEEKKTVEENDAAAASAQKQIQEELQKMQIANNNEQQQQQQQQLLLHQLKINEENGVDCYTQKNPEKVNPLPANNSHLQVHPGPVHASFLPSGGYPEQVYLIQTASGLYQAVRPVTVTAAPLGPTYYALPRMVPASNIAGAAYNGGSQVGVVNENGYSQVGVPHLPERSVGWN